MKLRLNPGNIGHIIFKPRQFAADLLKAASSANRGIVLAEWKAMTIRTAARYLLEGDDRKAARVAPSSRMQQVPKLLSPCL